MFAERAFRIAMIGYVILVGPRRPVVIGASGVCVAMLLLSRHPTPGAIRRWRSPQTDPGSWQSAGCNDESQGNGAGNSPQESVSPGGTPTRPAAVVR